MIDFLNKVLSPFTVDKKKYNKVKTKANADNIKSLTAFSLVSFCGFLGMLIASFMIEVLYVNRLVYLVYALIYLVFFIVTAGFPKQHEKVATFLVYMFTFFLWMFGILTGTILDPTNTTVSYVVLIVAVPLLFFGRPYVIFLMSILTLGLYLFIAFQHQTMQILVSNMTNIIPYTIVSFFVCSYVMKIKIQRYDYMDENSVLAAADQETTEKMQRYEQFINEMIRNASSECEPDEVINQLMQYIGEKLDSDRAYIFEDNMDGTFRNSYEWCKEGVSKEIDNLQNVPYKNMLDIWFDQYRKSHNILIYDIEEYRKVSQPLYDLLKPQGIKTLVTGPITISGKMVGFYGVDNPPKKTMENISELIEMMEFVVSMMIRLRDNAKSLELSATYDQLTDCKNRKALTWAYDGKYEKSLSMSIVMCDLNGLKAVNDKQGHEAGDKFICRTADILKEIFGKDSVYRMGGDEFVVALLGKTKKEIDDLMELVRLQVGNTASLGVVYSDDEKVSFDELLKEADTEMYKHKKAFYEAKNKETKGE